MDDEILETTWKVLQEDTNKEQEGAQRQSTEQSHTHSAQQIHESTTQSITSVEDHATTTITQEIHNDFGERENPQSNTVPKLTAAERREIRKKKLQERGQSRLDRIRGLPGKPPDTTESTEDNSTIQKHAEHTAGVFPRKDKQSTSSKHEKIHTKVDCDLQETVSESTTQKTTDNRIQEESQAHSDPPTSESKSTSPSINVFDDLRAVWKTASFEAGYSGAKWLVLISLSILLALQLPRCPLNPSSDWFILHAGVGGSQHEEANYLLPPRYLTTLRYQEGRDSISLYYIESNFYSVLEEKTQEMDERLFGCKVIKIMDKTWWFPFSLPLLIMFGIQLFRSVIKAILIRSASGKWTLDPSIGLQSSWWSIMWFLITSIVSNASETVKGLSFLIFNSILVASMVDYWHLVPF